MVNYRPQKFFGHQPICESIDNIHLGPKVYILSMARVTRLSPAFRVRLWLRETSLYHPVVDIQPPVFDRLQHTAKTAIKTAIKTGGGEGQGTRRAYHPVADVQQGYGGQHEPPPWVHTVLHAVASLHARGREGKGNLGRGSGGGGGGGGLAVLYV